MPVNSWYSKRSMIKGLARTLLGLNNIFLVIGLTFCFGMSFNSFAMDGREGGSEGLGSQADAKPAVPAPCVPRLNTAGVPAGASIQKENRFPTVETGIGPRGFLGASPALTPQNKLKALDKRIIDWTIKVKPVKTEQAAIDEVAKEPNALKQYLYVVTAETPGDNEPGAATSELSRLLFQEGGSGLIEVVDGKAVRVNDELVRARVLTSPTSMMKIGDGSYVFAVDGWTYPSQRGLLVIRDMMNRSLREDAAKRVRTGYTLKWNADFEGSLAMLIRQKRSYKDADGVRRFKTDDENRFRNPAVVDFIRYSHAQGRVLTVEMYNPQGVMVAGILSLISGRLYAPESIFYDSELDSKAYDLCKDASVALMDRLVASKINFVDMQMITEFTAQLGAKYRPAADFEAFAKRLPQHAVPDFVSPWTPWQAHFDAYDPAKLAP